MTWEIKTNLILQFTSLLFFSPIEIFSYLNKNIKNWIDVYEYYSNPMEIFLELKVKIIPEEYISIFFLSCITEEKSWNELLKSIKWGFLAEWLNNEFIWNRNYFRPQDSTKQIISFEILDIILRSLKSMKNPFEKKDGVVYTSYTLAFSILKRGLFQLIRKSLGISLNSFSYMKDLQNLSEKNKKQLKDFLSNVKILDPATGTGVFLFAAANLLKSILTSLMPDCKTRDIKFRILENNIFGIDLDPLAIQISAIKFFLWFFEKDEKKTMDNLNPKLRIFEGDALFGFQALPKMFIERKNNNSNFNYINNILDQQFELISSQKLAIYKIFSSTNLEQLISIIEGKIEDIMTFLDFKFFILEGDKTQWNQNKDKLSSKLVKKIQYSLPRNNKNMSHFYAVFRKRLDSTTYSKRNSPPFEFREFPIPKKFHWIETQNLNGLKFDLIVGNPPFIALTDLSLIYRERLKLHYANIYSGNNDLSYFFIKRSLDILNQNGMLTFILPKYFVHSLHAKKIRKYISSFIKISEIHDIGNIPIFPNIGIRNIILILEKKATPSKHRIDFIKYYKKFAQIIIKKTQIMQSELTPDKWILIDTRERQLLLRIKNSTKIKLKDIAHISKGIETGCDKVFTSDKPYFFTRKLRISLDHVKPWIKGKHVKRFFIRESDQEVLFCPYYRENEIKKNKKIMQYLKTKKTLLMNRSRVLKYYLWRLGDERRTMNWNSPKIVTPYRASQNTFAIDWNGSLSSKDVVWIIPKESKKDFLPLIAGLLNSNVLKYVAICTNKDLGGIYEYYPKQIENYPIVLPKNESNDLKNICSLVTGIMNIHHSNTKEKLEKQLNEIIYRLYDLSNKDIELIESVI